MFIVMVFRVFDFHDCLTYLTFSSCFFDLSCFLLFLRDLFGGGAVFLLLLSVVLPSSPLPLWAVLL